eukprot:2687266-Pyramimonas_sp.AAC.2
MASAGAPPGGMGARGLLLFFLAGRLLPPLDPLHCEHHPLPLAVVVQDVVVVLPGVTHHGALRRVNNKHD